MIVDIWSDTRCPFCFIGKKNFEKALQNFTQNDKIQVNWHSFQLDPKMKTDLSRNHYEYLSDIKGHSLQETIKMHENLIQIGRNAGIDFNFDESKVANSFRGHLLIQLAKEKNLADAMEEALFEAQFISGKNIDDEAVLLETGKSVGLTEEEVKNVLVSDEMAHAVAQDGLMARQLSINAVPFFVFNDKYGVSGAQQPEHFLEVLNKSFEEFSTGDKGLQIISQGESCDTDGNCD